MIVTGASGFIGSYLLRVLARSDVHVVAASRSPIDLPGIEWRLAPELGADADWSSVLYGAHAVVHLAGRSHIGLRSAMEEMACQRINSDGTKRLAQQAVEHAIKHFIFISSCHSVASESERKLTSETQPHPVSAYGRSKLAGERAVVEELNNTGCAWTIIRPPAVYGSGHNSSLTKLARLVFRGFPLPFASVRNRRSFIYVENLADAILVCLGNPKAHGKTFFVSDGEDMSTPDLIRAISGVNFGVQKNSKNKTKGGMKARYSSCMPPPSPPLFAFPENILAMMGTLPGFGALRKLTSSLCVDSEPILHELGWTPPFSMQEGLRRTLAEAITD